MTPRPATYILLIVYMLLLAAGSLAPIPIKADMISVSDKVIHFLLYIPLGCFLALVNLSRFSLGSVLVALGFGALYGGLLEILQNFVSGRTASLSDEMANVLGVTTGILVVALRQKGKAQRGKDLIEVKRE
jgi:VanZ family protein